MGYAAGFDWQWEELTKRKIGELLGERLAKGRAQYGKLDPNKKQSREWLQELVEELLDGFVYAYMLATKLGMYQPEPPKEDEQRERAKQAERARDDWKARHDQVFAEADRKIDELRRAGKNADAFAHAMAARAGAAERLAADALRIGLEECERLRAELNVMQAAAQQVANTNKMLRAELAVRDMVDAIERGEHRR